MRSGTYTWLHSSDVFSQPLNRVRASALGLAPSGEESTRRNASFYNHYSSYLLGALPSSYSKYESLH